MENPVIDKANNPEYYECRSTKVLADGTVKTYLFYRKRKNFDISKYKWNGKYPKTVLQDLCKTVSQEDAVNLIEIVKQYIEKHKSDEENKNIEEKTGVIEDRTGVSETLDKDFCDIEN